MKTQRTATPEPETRPDGTCSACVGGGLCTYHQEQGLARDRKRAATIRLASIGARENEIGRTCARYELESDEGGTARDKALRIMAQ